MVKTNAAAKAWAPKAKLKTPGGLIGQDEPDRHDGIGAPKGDPGKGEPEELLHPGRRRVPPGRRPQAGPGVPAGNGNTGPFLALTDSKQLKTFFPLLKTGTYCTPLARI